MAIVLQSIAVDNVDPSIDAEACPAEGFVIPAELFTISKAIRKLFASHDNEVATTYSLFIECRFGSPSGLGLNNSLRDTLSYLINLLPPKSRAACILPSSFVVKRVWESLVEAYDGLLETALGDVADVLVTRLCQDKVFFGRVLCQCLEAALLMSKLIWTEGYH